MSIEIVEDAGEQSNETDTDNEKYLLFRVGAEYYGASLEEILEVLEPIDTSSLPDAAKDCLGVMNLRGEVISVYDLRITFGTEVNNSENNFMIVIASNDTKCALLVDQMMEVHDFHQNQIESCPNLRTSLPNESLKGIGKIDKKLIYLIQLGSLIAA